METPLERMASLAIGTVEAVSPDKITACVDVEAPQGTALNTGTPTSFPNLNGYALVPTHTGAIVGLIVWIGIERTTFPRRKGLKDFDIIDLPFPTRKMVLLPVGTLLSQPQCDSDETQYRLQRGVSLHPTVGDPVLLPTTKQLRAIIESEGSDRRIQIGRSPLSPDVRVSVDPNKMFGRHLAVLGNTGSGKSCSVAGLIRWSLDAAQCEIRKRGEDEPVNARFVVLDPNGEYAEAFRDLGDRVRLFRVPPTEPPVHPLCVPVWMWNSQEWSAFASAAPGVQRPLLLRALREVKSGARLDSPPHVQAKRLFRHYSAVVQSHLTDGPRTYAQFPGTRTFGLLARNISSDAERFEAIAVDIAEHLAVVRQRCTEVADRRYAPYPDRTTGEQVENYNPFAETDLREMLEAIQSLLDAIPTAVDIDTSDEDAPLPFEVDALTNHLEHLAAQAGSGALTQFVDTLTLRIRNVLADGRIRSIVSPAASPTLEEWLTDYIGDDGASNGQLAIIDLSLVSSDVVHIAVAVLARLVFEAVQRYRKVNGQELPTVLVMEEAHNFIRRGSDETERAASAAQMCRWVFDRIAREGRKFGLGLVLSSQRPSELSPTVLAQCNSFLIHRVVNDRDQELLAKLVPDNLSGMLRDLPSLPTRQAVLLGWATPIPILVEMRNLPPEHRPRSADPKFWEVWTGEETRPIDWSAVTTDWTERA